MGAIVSECLLQEFARGFRRGERLLPADTVPQNSDEGVLPADSLVPAFVGRAANFLQIHQVEDDVIGAQVLLQFFLLNAARADHYNLRLPHYLRQIVTQQGTDMRDDFFDVLAI